MLWHPQCRCRLRTGQVGSSLIEPLLSVLIFSVVALGIAAFQTTALLRVDDAGHNSLAVYKAQELVEKIRASQPNDKSQAYLAHIANAIGNISVEHLLSDSTIELQCSAKPPSECRNSSSGAIATCSAKQAAELALWSTFCEPQFGVAASASVVSQTQLGVAKLRGLGLAMRPDATGYKLYLRWLSRSPAKNTHLLKDGASSHVLCAERHAVDLRFAAYCIRLL